MIGRSGTRRWASVLCGLLGVLTACGGDGGRLEVEVPSQAERALVYGQACSVNQAAGAGALLLEGRANFGGGLEDIHTVVCSLVLIRPGVALTAAHCVDLEALGATFVAEAEFYATFETDIRAVIESNAPFPEDATLVRAFVIHPSFDASSFSEATGLSEANDLAVLFLEDARSDVLLPTLNTSADAVGLGTQVSLAGHGTTEAASASAQADGVGRLRCVNSFVNATVPSEVQVGSGETTGRRCYGDSGGPTYLRNAPGTLVGLGSRAWSTDDGCSVGSVDVRLDFFSDFIHEALENACEDGGPRADCDTSTMPFDAGETDAGSTDAGAPEDGGGDGGSHQLDASVDVDAGELWMDGGVPEPPPPDDAGTSPKGTDGGFDAGDATSMSDGGQETPNGISDAGVLDDVQPMATCACALADRETARPLGMFALLLILLPLKRRRRSYLPSSALVHVTRNRIAPAGW